MFYLSAELLLAAGWRVEDSVLKNRQGEAFEIEFMAQNPEDTRILLPYLAQLEQLGIRATLRLIENAQYINRLREFDYEALLRDADILMPPIVELRATYHSDSVMQPIRNPAGISHPALDYLVEQAELAPTLEQMIALGRAIDRVLLWQYYQIPLFAVDRPRTVHWDRFGKPDFEPHYWPAFPDGWWYDEARAARIHLD